jgi:hypothetical protein
MAPRAARLFVALLVLAASGSTAFADDVPALCTDRPTKSNSPCTVPEGMWQLESDVGNFTDDDHAGVHAQTLYIINPYLKYGLSPHTDIEVNWAPSVLERVTNDGGHHVAHGVGDFYVRLKSTVYTGDVVNASIIPFVKAPTATQGIGNGQWEGGVALPVGVALGDGFTMLLGPELDALADMDGRGHHLAATNLINVSHALTSKLSFAVEYWRQNNFDPSGRRVQASGDVALVYAVNATLQLDLGANTGLNRSTPNEQIYFGVSHRW